MFRAVEINGEAYWDGGYTGNPALFPLFAPDLPNDIVNVNINPLYREDVPTEAREILNGINEVSFNSPLLRELRAISFVQRLLEVGHIDEGAMKRVNVHIIADDALMRQMSVAPKMLPVPSVLAELKSAGRTAADDLLMTHGNTIGHASSVDLPSMYGSE